ncbi:hypothetical protein [Selenomonas ruminis]|nr:hypothetical protein [Selenomonas sp. mPRGC5]
MLPEEISLLERFRQRPMAKQEHLSRLIDFELQDSENTESKTPSFSDK